MIRVALSLVLLLSPMSVAVAGEDTFSPSPALDQAPPGPAQPMVVTSDTDAYCETLSREIDAHADPLPHEVIALRDQGEHLCAIGQVRGGINRLRRALMALRGGNDEARDDGNSEMNVQ